MYMRVISSQKNISHSIRHRKIQKFEFKECANSVSIRITIHPQLHLIHRFYRIISSSASTKLRSRTLFLRTTTRGASCRRLPFLASHGWGSRRSVLFIRFGRKRRCVSKEIVPFVIPKISDRVRIPCLPRLFSLGVRRESRGRVKGSQLLVIKKELDNLAWLCHICEVLVPDNDVLNLSENK